MTAPFQSGDKVVCVDASPGRVTRSATLTLGGVYCVEACWESLYRYQRGQFGVRLCGEQDAYNEAGLLVGWHTDRFRKVWSATDSVAVTERNEATP